MSRPFFSLVVACYNDGRYTEGKYLDRLLDSLTKQEVTKEELEVILVDDCSPVGFDDVVEKYADTLNIVRTKTDYNFAPGNTRAKGVEIATGEWLCFADHDDKYYEKGLKLVKDKIIERHEKYFCFTDFNGVNPDESVKKVYKCTLNWCHGKFYNVDNVWKPFNIHFIHDLKSHEDIAICTQMSCVFSRLTTELTYIPVSVYAWTDNPESVSHVKYHAANETEETPRYFLEVFFEDYLEATGYIYLNSFKRHDISIKFAVTRCIETLTYCYFYTQGFQFARKDFLRENLVFAGKFLNEVKDAFNITNQQVYDAIAEDNAAIYRRIRPMADPGAGAYIPQQSMIDWIDLIDKSFVQSKEKEETT